MKTKRKEMKPILNLTNEVIYRKKCDLIIFKNYREETDLYTHTHTKIFYILYLI